MSNILTLKEEAKLEIYKYFDKHIRALPKDEKGSFKEASREFIDNDVDALRHAYVSGVYTMEYNEDVAEKLGRLQELVFSDSSSAHPKAENMDLWNNSVGRKYGKKAKSRDELFEFLLKALKDNELIIDPDDDKKFKGDSFIKRVPKSMVIKIQENRTGANIMFYDFNKKIVMSKDEFLVEIKNGNYSSYSYKVVDDVEIPISKRDRYKFNNLG